MNMSFGVQAAPPASGDVGGVDPPSASSAPSIASTPLPPVPAPFSASFTFQGASGNVLPPSRPLSTPAGFSYTGAPPRFTYPNAPLSVPPPSASPVSPFSLQPGFTFQGSATPQAGAVGQSPAVGVRPFPPTGMVASVSPPTQVVISSLQVANSQGSQTVLPGSTSEETSMQVPSMPTGTGVSAEATPPPSLQVNAGTQARLVAQPTVTPSMTGVPGQIQIPAVSPVGSTPAGRPGVSLPTSTTLPFVPSRPTFTPAPVAGASIVPPGVLSYCFGEAAKLLILVENIKHLL